MGGILAEFRIADWIEQYRMVSIGGERTHVFRVAVHKNSDSRVQHLGYPGGRVAWEEFVYVDRNSRHVLTIVLESVHIPRSYGIVKAYLSVSYGSVEIDGEPHPLPTASESVVFLPSSLPVSRQSSR